LYRTEGGAAPRAASLAVSHSLSPDWELSASYNFSDGSTLLSSDVNSYYLLQRTDMRLARAFKLGKNKAELALTVQNLGPASMNSDRKFFFDQRAMLTLRVGD
jgi:iron complex outermembrane receptor protein